MRSAFSPAVVFTNGQLVVFVPFCVCVCVCVCVDGWQASRLIGEIDVKSLPEVLTSKVTNMGQSA